VVVTLYLWLFISGRVSIIECLPDTGSDGLLH